MCPLNIVLSYHLAWLISLVVFLSSKRQLLTGRRVDKTVAWLLFGLGYVFSTWLLLPTMSSLAAFLQVMMVVMVSWVGLALGAPYLKRLWLVVVSGAVFFGFSAMIGAA